MPDQKRSIFRLSPEDFSGGDGSWTRQWFFQPMRTRWDINDFRPERKAGGPSLNLTVMGLILSAVIDCTVGRHAYDLAEQTLASIGFTDLLHRNFEFQERIDRPAAVFGRSRESVGGKTVVAAVFRGTSSAADVVSDLRAEPGGFYEAGMNAQKQLKDYLTREKLSRENTILYITGHSYGAAAASLAAISALELAGRNAVFAYTFAPPNYARRGLSGEGLEMYAFVSSEDVVPQVPVGPALDKTGKVITLDRLEYKLHRPDCYARFERVYRYLRGKDFEEDSDFQPKEYTFRSPVHIPNRNPLSRSHLPYTYMALILAELPEDCLDLMLSV